MSATKAVHGDGKAGRSDELPVNTRCADCTARVDRDDVVLRIAPGQGVKPLYVHEGCVLDLLAVARGVEDPMFERYRARVVRGLRR